MISVVHSKLQWTYHAIQNGEAEVVQFGQCLHASQDCGTHSDNRFDAQECESCQCSTRWPDKAVELNSGQADLGEIKWLLVFTRNGNGILLSVMIVRIPCIELSKLLFHHSLTRYSDSVVTVENCQQHGDYTASGSSITMLPVVINGDYTVTG